MTVIAIINPKGGCGKSTLATHIAAYLSLHHNEIMLGDVDRQQSSRLWLGLRPEQLPKIHGWSVDENNFARPPAGIRHIVLDTPGGFHGFSLMKVTMSADAIVIPTGASLFDRQASTAYVQELKQLPRVVSGKCRLACVGMRVDGRTKNGAAIGRWAEEHGLEQLGCIRLAQAYVRCLEQGLSIFDFPDEKVAPYLKEWRPLLRWLEDILAAAPALPGSAMQKPVAPPGISSHCPVPQSLLRAS